MVGIIELRHNFNPSTTAARDVLILIIKININNVINKKMILFFLQFTNFKRIITNSRIAVHKNIILIMKSLPSLVCILIKLIDIIVISQKLDFLNNHQLVKLMDLLLSKL